MHLFFFNHQFSKKYLFLLLLTIPIHLFASDASDIATIISKMDNRFSGIASTKKIGTMGVDSMNTFFESVLKKIPSIATLMRINSNGKVINEISSDNAEFKMRDVSDQRWFLHAKNTRSSYYGTTRDSSGTTLFFWAWPIIANDSMFNGVITAKIKPSGILAMATVDPETPIGLFLNSQVVYKQNYSIIGAVISDTIPLSSISNIIIQTQNQDSALAVSDPVTAKDTLMQQETRGSDTIVNSAKDTTPAPIVYKSDFLEPVPQKKHAPITIIVTLLLSLLFLFAAVYVILKNRKAQKAKELILPEIDPEELKAYKVSTKPFEEETIQLSMPDFKEITIVSETKTSGDKNDDVEIDTDTDHIIIDTTDEMDSTDISNDSFVFVEHDDETRSHPPVLFADPTGLAHEKGMSVKDSQAGIIDKQEQTTSIVEVDNTKEDEEALDEDLLDTSAEISPELKMRNAVYEEVHNEVVYWITSEANRLENRIEELEKRLVIIEKLNTPEIHQIRKDIDDMSRDITTFRSGKDTSGKKSY
jgi:hypothetical protein